MDNEIVISTGNIANNYEIIDVICAHFSESISSFDDVDQNKIFENAKSALKVKCAEVGGQAVINCRFEHQTRVVNNIKKIFEVYAYGTAIKLK